MNKFRDFNFIFVILNEKIQSNKYHKVISYYDFFDKNTPKQDGVMVLRYEIEDIWFHGLFN